MAWSFNLFADGWCMSDYTGSERRKIVSDQVERIVELSVIKTLTGLGFDMHNPLEMQKDIAHLRKWRVIADVMISRALYAAMAILVTGIFAMVWAGVKSQVASSNERVNVIPSIPEKPVAHG